MGGYTVASSLEASEDKSDGSGSANDAEDDDDGSPSDDEMTTWFTCPYHSRQKESSFEMRVVIIIGGGLVSEIGVVFIC